jgi:hypothetical protein
MVREQTISAFQFPSDWADAKPEGADPAAEQITSLLFGSTVPSQGEPPGTELD